MDPTASERTKGVSTDGMVFTENDHTIALYETTCRYHVFRNSPTPNRSLFRVSGIRWMHTPVCSNPAPSGERAYQSAETVDSRGDGTGRRRTLNGTEAGRPADRGSGRRLVEGYLAGKTVYELGRSFGIARQTVSEHLHRRGVPMRRRGLDEAQRPEVLRLRDEGWSLKRLGERFGVDASTVRNALLRDTTPLSTGTEPSGPPATAAGGASTRPTSTSTGCSSPTRWRRWWPMTSTSSRRPVFLDAAVLAAPTTRSLILFGQLHQEAGFIVAGTIRAMALGKHLRGV